jgi:hypothetical protein
VRTCIQAILTLAVVLCAFGAASAQVPGSGAPPSTLSVVKDVVSVLGGISIVIGLLTFWFNFQKFREERQQSAAARAAAESKRLDETREREVREWQKVVVYKILNDAAPDALSFDAIRSRYITEAAAFERHEVKKVELSSDALWRVLLELLQYSMIAQSKADHFQLKLTPEDLQRAFMEETVKIERGLVTILSAKPFAYTAAEIAYRVHQQAGVSEERVRIALDQALNMLGTIVADDEERLALKGARK